MSDHPDPGLTPITQVLKLSLFVALLRGVNVGKAKRLPMAEFRAVLSGLGYTRVATLLNSGNAIFWATGGTPAQHAAAIAEALSTSLGFDVPVVVKSAEDLAAIVAENPLKTTPAHDSRLVVVFTQQCRELSGLEKIRPLVALPEQFAIGENAAYLLCPGGILQSKAGAAILGKAAGVVTTRNWATTLKLHALATAGASNTGA